MYPPLMARFPNQELKAPCFSQVQQTVSESQDFNGIIAPEPEIQARASSAHANDTM